jgi:Uma2 family endonuclease
MITTTKSTGDKLITQWPAAVESGGNGHTDEVTPRSQAGRRVSEEEYWTHYYENPDFHYEWNDGILEEKPVADYRNAILYRWFLILIDAYLASHPLAKLLNLEMGFRLQLPSKVTIRKPDLFVVCDDNPVDIDSLDRTFRGICDLAVESLSDLTKEEIEHDTITKKEEYETIGVREYYILDASGEHTAFYWLTPDGDYLDIEVGQDGVIRSQVLPGFQFRLDDLDRLPKLIDLAVDPVYSGFVLPEFVAERERANRAEAHAEQERQRAEQEHQRAEQERQRAERAEARERRLSAKLRALGIEENGSDPT